MKLEQCVNILIENLRNITTSKKLDSNSTDTAEYLIFDKKTINKFCDNMSEIIQDRDLDGYLWISGRYHSDCRNWYPIEILCSSQDSVQIQMDADFIFLAKPGFTFDCDPEEQEQFTLI